MAETSPEGDVAPTRLLTALREATRPMHASLERRVPLTSPALTREAYGAVIEALYGYHVPLEQRLDGAIVDGAGLEWERRRRARLLRTDLLALGREEADVALPRCERLPSLSSPSEAFGCLYVVEGATLGGRVLSRLLRDHLGVDAGTGAAFFAGYGESTGLMWRRFLACLTSAERDIDEERLTAAAVETFTTLERWLEERRVLS